MSQNKWVKMLTDVGEGEAKHVKGDRVELDTPTAESWIAAGFAEAADEKSISDMVSDAINKELVGIADKIKVPSEAPTIKVTQDADDKVRSFGDFVKAFCHRDVERLHKVYNAGYKTTVSGENVATGDALIPDEFVPELYKADGYDPIVRKYARIYPMQGDTLKIPALDQSGTSSSNSNFYGGVAVSRTKSGPAPETAAGFEMIDLHLNPIRAHIPIDNNMFEDSPMAVNTIITELMAGAYNNAEDEDFLIGSGVGRAKGALESDAALSVSRSSATTFKLVDAAKMIGSLSPGSFKKAVWVISQTVFQQLLQLADAGNNNVYISNARDDFEMRLFGKPVFVSEHLPALGTAKDVCLCNFKAYAIGEKPGGFKLSSSIHADYLNENTLVMISGRVAGQSQQRTQLTLKDGTTKVSPYVYLT